MIRGLLDHLGNKIQIVDWISCFKDTAHGEHIFQFIPKGCKSSHKAIRKQVKYDFYGRINE